MKLNAFLSGILLGALAVAAAAATRTARATETPGPAQVEVISTMKDTSVYYIRYAGHSCFIASTIGGSGISLQCPQ